jgi:hypothetical protein
MKFSNLLHPPPDKTEGFPLGEKGSLKYFTALNDGVLARLILNISQNT